MKGKILQGICYSIFLVFYAITMFFGTLTVGSMIADFLQVSHTIGIVIWGIFFIIADVICLKVFTYFDTRPN